MRLPFLTIIGISVEQEDRKEVLCKDKQTWYKKVWLTFVFLLKKKLISFTSKSRSHPHRTLISPG